MRRTFIWCCLVFIVAMGSVALSSAQNFDKNAIPKYIWIETDSFRSAADQQAFVTMVKSFKEAIGQSDFYWLGEYAVGGNATNITFVCYRDSAAAVEKALDEENRVMAEIAKTNPSVVAQATAGLTNTHYALAKSEPDLSINPDKIDHSKLTRVNVMMFQLRPGATSEFEEALKEFRDLHLKANDDMHAIVYRVVAGGGPGFLVVIPMNTLAELDKPDSPAFEALMTPTVRKHFEAVLRETVVSQTSELYVIDPVISRPPQSYIAANPDFWQVKSDESTAVTAKKKSKKAIAELEPKH